MPGEPDPARPSGAQRDWGLRFHPTDNPQLLCYSKRSQMDAICCSWSSNLDPLHMQHGHVELPLAAWQLSPDSACQCRPAPASGITGAEAWNYVRLDPATAWRILRCAGTGAAARTASGD